MQPRYFSGVCVRVCVCCVRGFVRVCVWNAINTNVQSWEQKSKGFKDVENKSKFESRALSDGCKCECAHWFLRIWWREMWQVRVYFLGICSIGTTQNASWLIVCKTLAPVHSANVSAISLCAPSTADHHHSAYCLANICKPHCVRLDGTLDRKQLVRRCHSRSRRPHGRQWSVAALCANPHKRCTMHVHPCPQWTRLNGSRRTLSTFPISAVSVHYSNAIPFSTRHFRSEVVVYCSVEWTSGGICSRLVINTCLEQYWRSKMHLCGIATLPVELRSGLRYVLTRIERTS